MHKYINTGQAPALECRKIIMPDGDVYIHACMHTQIHTYIHTLHTYINTGQAPALECRKIIMPDGDVYVGTVRTIMLCMDACMHRCICGHGKGNYFMYACMHAQLNVDFTYMDI